MDPLPHRPSHMPWIVTAFILGLAAGGAFWLDRSWSYQLADLGRMPVINAFIETVKVFGRGEIAALLVLLIASRDPQRAWRLALALLVATALVWAFKVGVGRTRPNGGEFSFVSGDTATIAVFIPLAAGWWRLVAILATIAVAGGRLIQGWHFPSDVLAGASAALIGGAVVLNASAPRWWMCFPRLAWIGLAAGLAATLLVLGLADVTPFGLRFLMVFGPATVLLATIPWLRARRFPRPPPVVATIAIAAVLLTALAAGTSLWDRDEPRNATAAREMLDAGNWIVPTFNGDLRLKKPILPYWGMMASLSAGRPFALAEDLLCRLPAVLASLGILAFAAWQARLLARSSAWSRDATRDAGRWAALALATFPLLIVTGTAATTDAVLLIGIMGAMTVVIHALSNGLTPWTTLLMGLAIGWAILGKGPLGVLVPFSALALAWFLARGVTPLTWRAIPWFVFALVVGLLVFLAWGIPVDRATNGEFYRVAVHETLGRSGKAQEGHSGPLFYYLPVLVLGCLPWAALLPAALVAIWRGWLGMLPRAVVVGWAVPTFILLSLVATKLPHYLLPVFPAMAIALALYLVHLQRCGTTPSDRFLITSGRFAMAWILGIAGVAIAALPWLPIPKMPALPGSEGAITGIGVLLIAGGIALAAIPGGRRPGALALTLALFTALLVTSFALVTGPAIERHKVWNRFAIALKAQLPPDAVVKRCGEVEPSFVFALGHGIVAPVPTLPWTLDWFKLDERAIVIFQAPVLSELQLAAGDAGLRGRELLRMSGFNYSNGRPVTLVAWDCR